MNKQTDSIEKILTKVLLAKLQKNGLITQKQQEIIIQKY